MRSKTLLACLTAAALALGLVACSDDDSGGNNNSDLCGNGALDDGELCDGMAFGGETCVSLGMNGGALACTADCTFDTSGCAGCGNGIIEVGEVCDGSNLDGQTCMDVGAFNGGDLTCSADCTGYDTSACTTGCPVAATDITSAVGSSTTVSTAGESDDFTGECGGGGAPDTLLSFVAPNTASYVVSTVSTSTDYDTLLFAFTDCMDAANTEIACNDDVNDAYQSAIVVSVNAGDTVYVVLDGYDGSSSGTAEVSITEINCTDDGNEDDDNESTATAIGGPFPVSAGGVLCPDDISADYDMVLDFYLVTIPAGEVLDASILAGTMTDCTQQDLFIEFYDSTLQNVLGNASSNGTDCPQVVGVADPAGTDVYMVIGAPSGTTFNQDYNFTLTTRVAICGDGVVDANEQCDDGNSTSGDGCENDCTVTPICLMTADNDLGTLVSGTPTNAQIDLTAQTHDYPDLPCVLAEGGGGGQDYMYNFTVTASGNLTIDVDHTGGDVMYALHTVDASCTEVGCYDIYPDVTGQIVEPVTPGDYRLLVQAISTTYAANVSVTLTMP